MSRPMKELKQESTKDCKASILPPDIRELCYSIVYIKGPL